MNILSYELLMIKEQISQNTDNSTLSFQTNFICILL